MPYANGSLLIAVKAEIRKAIGKEEGYEVHLIHYKDTSVFKIPDDFKKILTGTPGAYERFSSHKQWEQRMCINWIFSAKREETRAERVKKTLYRLQNRQKIV